MSLPTPSQALKPTAHYGSAGDFQSESGVAVRADANDGCGGQKCIIVCRDFDGNSRVIEGDGRTWALLEAGRSLCGYRIACTG